MNTQIAGATLLVLSLIAIRPVVAQDAAADNAGPAASASISKKDGKLIAKGKVVSRGTITNVDPARREFTVRRSKGDEVVVPVSEKVKNFNQIKVGDQIVLRQSESIVLSLKKTEKGMRKRSVAETTTLAKPGEKPSISATRETHVVADVTAVDKKKGTITLKGVNRSRTFQLSDPALLADIKKGDQVEAVLMEGEALSIEAAKAP
jgi:Cu/Ag efflux protein CusF